jgi:Fe-Mn family superoxide dismutase
LHTLFWENLCPANKTGPVPKGKIAEEITKEFGSFERFKKEFSQAAASAEGSGWAALVHDKQSGKILIMQIEKHNVNVFPAAQILLVLDVWEHAYYLDCKNDRAKFIEGTWNIIDWSIVSKRLEKAKK